MTINKTQNGSSVVLSPVGRLDTLTAPLFQEALLPEIRSAEEVSLDFSQLSYVSSAGLRVLLMGHKLTKETGNKMNIINVCDEIMEVFKMTGFISILQIEQ